MQFDSVKYSNERFRSIREWHLHLKWPDPSVRLQVLPGHQVIHEDSSTTVSQCLKNVPPLQNACTSTNISALFIFLPGNASEYKSMPTTSILLSESNLTAATRPWADDRWQNIIGQKKETAISHKNYFMFNIWLVSFQILYLSQEASQNSDTPWNNQNMSPYGLASVRH